MYPLVFPWLRPPPPCPEGSRWQKNASKSQPKPNLSIALPRVIRWSTSRCFSPNISQLILAATSRANEASLFISYRPRKQNQSERWLDPQPRRQEAKPGAPGPGAEAGHRPVSHSTPLVWAQTPVPRGGSNFSFSISHRCVLPQPN